MFVGTHNGAREVEGARGHDRLYKRQLAQGVGITAGLALSLFATSAAPAMNCAPAPGGALIVPAAGGLGRPAAIIAAPGISSAAVSSMLGSTIAAANTAFLLQ